MCAVSTNRSGSVNLPGIFRQQAGCPSPKRGWRYVAELLRMPSDQELVVVPSGVFFSFFERPSVIVLPPLLSRNQKGVGLRPPSTRGTPVHYASESVVGVGDEIWSELLL